MSERTPRARAAARRARSPWEPDVLPGFEQLSLPLADDEEGRAVATLVRPAERGPADAGVDLLYVHGWSDYFFQEHLAAFWESLGVRFHALDLRKYGRSLREHQTPGFTRSLAVYAEEIEAALDVIGHPAPSPAPAGGGGPGRERRLILMAHSTGGLIMSLWAHHNPGRADALILNSPWLELHVGSVGRRMLAGPTRAASAVVPRGVRMPLPPNHYVRTISSRFEGEWDYDPALRPDDGWPAGPAWLNAVFRGHERVARGLQIDIPVLVLISARSAVAARWSEEMRRADAVLEVDEIARRVPRLGDAVTLVRLDGALHDVTLSAPDVRERLWEELTRWFRGYLGPAPSDAEVCCGA